MPTPDFEPTLQLAENVERLRKQKKMSLSQIAGRAKIHRTHVSLILRGKRTLRLDTFVRLAGALEVTPGELIAGITWNPDANKGEGAYEYPDGRPSRPRPSHDD